MVVLIVYGNTAMAKPVRDREVVDRNPGPLSEASGVSDGKNRALDQCLQSDISGGGSLTHILLLGSKK